MIFARIDKDNVIEYPVSDKELRKLYGDVCLPVDLNNCDYLESNGWVIIIDCDKPSFDSITQYCIESIPKLIDGIWHQSWIVNDYDDKTIASNRIEQQQQIRQELNSIVTQHIDATARLLGYESRLSICTYLTSNVIQFKNEAEAFISWRDSIWESCLQIQNDVLSGTRLPPNDKTILAELPVFSL